MKITHTIAAHLLVLAFPICTAKAQPSPTSNVAPDDLYAQSVGESPEAVIDYYERHAPTTSADFFTLALARYATADFGRALDLANRALSLQSDPRAQSVCFVLIAECHGALGQYDLAGEAALHGLRLGPSDKKVEKALAALRYAYATQAKDDLAAEAAKEHLMQLDADFAKHPTMEPFTMCIILVGIVCVTYIVGLIAQHKAQDPETRRTIGDSLKYLLIFATAAASLIKELPKTVAESQ
jgi:tetratricopeptide (TPR) repeat protein